MKTAKSLSEQHSQKTVIKREGLLVQTYEKKYELLKHTKKIIIFARVFL